MSSVNKVILIGRLGRDPESRYTSSGDALTNLTVATSEKWQDKTSGDTKETTEWHRIVLFRRLGEIANQYLRKGSQVYIEGKLQTRKWSDQDGINRWSTEIVGERLQMLGNPTQRAEAESDQPAADPKAYLDAKEGRIPSASKDTASAADDFPDSDIPF